MPVAISNAASRLAEQAVQAASKASDKSLTLLTQASAARTAAALQPRRALAAKLATLSQADETGLKSLAVESSMHGAEALLKLNDRPNALKEADSALAKAELLGFRLPQARALVRAEVLRMSDENARREASARVAAATRLRARTAIRRAEALVTQTPAAPRAGDAVPARHRGDLVAVSSPAAETRLWRRRAHVKYQDHTTPGFNNPAFRFSQLLRHVTTAPRHESADCRRCTAARLARPGGAARSGSTRPRSRETS